LLLAAATLPIVSASHERFSKTEFSENISFVGNIMSIAFYACCCYILYQVHVTDADVCLSAMLQTPLL